MAKPFLLGSSASNNFNRIDDDDQKIQEDEDSNDVLHIAPMLENIN